MEITPDALNGLRDLIMALAADENRAPQDELNNVSDTVLGAYWHGYAQASKKYAGDESLHAAAFADAAAAPLSAVCLAPAEVDQLRAALAEALTAA